MNAYTRETLVERRQLVIRWGAVFAGALVAAGISVPLHLLGANIAWSVIACIVALFAGGYLASQLAQTRDPRLAAAHGGLAWAVVAVLAAAAAIIAMPHRTIAGPDLATELEIALAPVNAQQHELGKPGVTSDQLIEATNGLDPTQVDPAKLADRLAATTTLTRAESLEVAHHLGDDVVDLATRARVEEQQLARLACAHHRASVGAGLALLFGLAGAILGSLAALRRPRTPRVEHTAPYPVVHDTLS